MGRPFENVIDRFVRNILIVGDCWEWQGSKTHNGYGQFSITKKPIRSHRWSYEFFVKPITSGSMVLHTCDNRCCVNPDHLFEGTAKDNTSDMLTRCREANMNTWKTHCKNGHEFNYINTRVNKSGERICRPCSKQYQRERKLWLLA